MGFFISWAIAKSTQSHGKKLFFFDVFKWFQAGKEKGAWFVIPEDFEHDFLLFLVE